MKNKQCLDCNKLIWHTAIRCKFCDIKYRFQNGYRIPPNTGRTRFKKGIKPWCAGTKGLIKAWNKGTHLSGMLGKKHSEKTILKMKINNKGWFKKDQTKGKNNIRWKGGITSINHMIRQSLEYLTWRTEVFKRDNYTCQNCNQRGKKLNADHIKPFALYPELRFNLDNGRTLCINCHYQIGAKVNQYGQIF